MSNIRAMEICILVCLLCNLISHYYLGKRIDILQEWIEFLHGIDFDKMTKAVRKWQAEQTEPQTHDIRTETHECVKDTHDKVETMSCQECKWWFTDSLKHGGYCQSLLYNHECRYEPEVDCSWK